MKSLWSDAEAAQFTGPLGPRVYTSRLLGARQVAGAARRRQYLGQAAREGPVRRGAATSSTSRAAAGTWRRSSADGFAPLPLAYMQQLPRLPALSDPQMVNELSTHVLRAGAPSPSVETLLHALLPHTLRRPHPRRRGARRSPTRPTARSASARSTASASWSFPTSWPGFDLAALLRARVPEAGDERDRSAWCCCRTASFSFGADARESYERMIELVSMAEDYLQTKKAWQHRPAAGERPDAFKREEDCEPAASDLRAGRAFR